MKTRHFIFSLMFLLGCISCSDDDSQPEIRPEPLSKANIQGEVQLWDEGLTGLDNADMTVRIEGLDIAAKTDTEGKFILPDVPFGTYDLIYEKAGYGTFKNHNIAHPGYYSSGQGVNDIGKVNLGQVSPTRVTGLSVELSGTDVLLTVKTDPPGSVGNEQYIRFYYSLTGSPYFTDNNEVIASYVKPIITHSSPETIVIPMEDILYPEGGSGFEGPIAGSGVEIFFKAYGESYWPNIHYDPKLGVSVHPNLNPSSADAVSFVVP